MKLPGYIVHTCRVRLRKDSRPWLAELGVGTRRFGQAAVRRAVSQSPDEVAWMLLDQIRRDRGHMHCSCDQEDWWFLVKFHRKMGYQWPMSVYFVASRSSIVSADIRVRHTADTGTSNTGEDAELLRCHRLTPCQR